MPVPRVHIQLALTESQYKDLKKYAAAHGMSMSTYVREALAWEISRDDVAFKPEDHEGEIEELVVLAQDIVSSPD